MSDGGSASQALSRRAPAAILGLLTLAAYAVIAVFTLFNGQTFAEEVSALVRGWWYATGAVTPYTPADVPAEMPLFFYELGYWQRLLGAGHLSGRILSIVLGGVSGLLLFSICRRLTANTLVAAAAAFIFLATPSTSFFFATATSAATVSALHLLALFLIVDSMGRPRAPVSAAMGLVCAAIYFTRQEMFLGVVVLIPLYIAAVGRDRLVQALCVLGALAAATAVVVVVFPAKVQVLALQFPLIGGLLGDAGLLGPDYTLVARGTHGPAGLGAALELANLKGLFESFALPNLGTLILALALFAAAAGPLKVLWIAPLYFLWLALTHYAALSTEGACSTCMQPVTPTFAAVGALAAALTLAMSGRWAKRNNLTPGAVIIAGALIAVALNTFATMLASHPQTRAFPRPMLDGMTAAPELAEIPVLTRWVAGQIKTKEPVLVIHGLGRADVAALPYAVAATGRAMPAVSLDLRTTRRTINQSLVGDLRDDVRAGVEERGLWSDEILARWIARDYNIILLQDDTTPTVAAIRKEIEAGFDRAGATRYRGASILMFTRKPAQ
jgi:hypothetical protein